MLTSSPFGAPSVPVIDPYRDYLGALRAHASTLTGPLFTTDAAGLYDAYLNSVLAEERASYQCNACKRFIETYGGLVQIEEDGTLRAALWNFPNDPLHINDVLAGVVKRAKVTGVFLTSEATWGTPVTGPWHHLAITPPKDMLYKGPKTLTPAQSAAEKREDYKMLSRALSEFDEGVVAKAVTLLQTEALYRSEKCLGVAEWLLVLHQSINTGRKAAKGPRRDHLLWLAVATAPPGYCHVRSTMIGTLLEDLAAGMALDVVARRFAEKMHPLQYQRPTAPPKDGAIAQAEKVVAQLGTAGALARRFAKLADVQALWLPKPYAPAKSEGLFAHLRAQAETVDNAGTLPMTPITWEKFARTVLPTAVQIELLVPDSGNFCAMVTAADAAAPPMVQWDAEEQRNPVSWYTYVHGSSARAWNLTPGQWLPVRALVLAPWMQRGGHFPHLGESVMFVLPGARDTMYKQGAGLFPETLRSEYHGIRAVLEAHFKQSIVAGAQEAEVCGLVRSKGNSATQVRLRVRVASGLTMGYVIDRWD
jgi:hypothetical protein